MFYMILGCDHDFKNLKSKNYLEKKNKLKVTKQF